MKYTCQYCKQDFIKESSLAVHSCEPRRRRQEKDERGVQLGLQAYLKFYQLTQGSAKLKTFDDFADSPYYRAFVKFGRYCVDIRAINPARFIEYVLKQNKKIDHWCRDSIYTEYLLNYLRMEHVNDALARAIEFGIAWQEQTSNPSCDCLRYGNSNAVCHAITSGRISPWVIYNSESGQKFLSELTSEQVAMIWDYIDSDVWMSKFRDYPADQEYAKDILAKAGW
jgi:hypothetical protein